MNPSQDLGPEQKLDPEASSPDGAVPSSSDLTQAWIQRMLDGIKRMNKDEEYRLSIAKMLS